MSARRTAAARAPLSRNQVFLHYFLQHDVFFCLEGVLKLLAIACCVVTAVVSLSGSQECPRAPALAGGAAGGALGLAGAQALLVAARALQLPRRAPHAALLTDIVSCSVCGVLAALGGALLLTLCRRTAPLHYLPGPLALVTAALLVGSATLVYSAAMRLWDAAVGPTREPRPLPASDHDV